MAEARPATINALSGARAIPPLILVLFHVCEAHGYRGAKWFDVPVGKGYLWVEFFFALSGFVLTYVYAPRMAEFWRGRAYVPFLKARLTRLYPLHLFTLLVILAMVIVLDWVARAHGYVSIYDGPWHPVVTWQTFVANLFLVQAWNLFDSLSWNGAAWFVSVEWLLCLLFPIWIWIATGRWYIAIALVAAGCAGLGYLATTGHGLDLTFHNGVYRGAAAFGIGVGLAMLYRDTKTFADTLPDYAFSLAQLGVLAALWWAIYRTGWSHRPQDIYTVLPELALIYALAFDRGFLATFFSTRPLQFFGEISYGVYMGQIPLLQLVRYAEGHWYPHANDIVFGHPWWTWTPVWRWVEPAVILAIAILWGWALFAWVEQPCAAVLKRWLAPRKPRVTAPA
jgi:peptidoglycan/LPS O-acetylase OafA/YrhL